MTNEFENFLKLAKLEFLDEHLEDSEDPSAFDALWYGVEWLLRQAVTPESIEELSSQAHYSPEEFRENVKKERETEMSLEEATFQVACSKSAIELIQFSKYKQTVMVNNGFAEFINGRLVPTKRGADELRAANRPLTMFDIRFDNVDDYKRAIRIVAQLVRESPDISDKELKAKVVSSLKSRNSQRRPNRSHRRGRRKRG